MPGRSGICTRNCMLTATDRSGNENLPSGFVTCSLVTLCEPLRERPPVGLQERALRPALPVPLSVPDSVVAQTPGRNRFGLAASVTPSGCRRVLNVRRLPRAPYAGLVAGDDPVVVPGHQLRPAMCMTNVLALGRRRPEPGARDERVGVGGGRASSLFGSTDPCRRALWNVSLLTPPVVTAGLAASAADGDAGPSAAPATSAANPLLRIVSCPPGDVDVLTLLRSQHAKSPDGAV